MQPDAVPPYDLRDEETPQHRFFSPEFQSALQKGLGIAKDTVEAIEKLDGLVTDSTLSKFLQTAKRLRVFHGSDTRTIAVLGDSGEGKSSLINSLLHFPGVAKTGDIGSACTSVVTEYRQKTSEHTAPITIEVEYLSTPEIEALLKELLWSYRQLYLPDIESDKTLPEDYARYQRQSAQAWSALEAAFKHKGEFKPERLQDMSDGALDRITTELIRWSEEIEWPEGGVNGLWRSTANTTEECCEKTEIFMKDKYWPFTKIIRIYLNAQVLKTGVVLADLPGLQDTNLARVRATQDYLMRCNNIFIVAKISRAITDQSLKTSLFTVLARQVPLEWDESAAKSLNVAVVCTKSEDINLETARREFCGTGKKIPLAVVQQLDQEIDDAKRAGNAALKKQLKLRRELLFIGARNQHVKEGLQTAYASKVPDRKLEVFCVSNKLYEKYTRKGNSDVVRASVIPELRKFCHSITAEAQLQEARHFLQSSLFSLLNSLYMWATSSLMETGPGTGESKEQIIEKLKKATKSWTKALRGLRRDFMLCFEEQILKMMENRYDAWETAADQEGREWDSWHWTQYKAWCLNNGDHETAKRGRVDWNAKIIWKMRTELEFQWDIVEEEISSLFGDLLTKLKSLLNSVKETILESCPSEFRDSLVDGINARIRHCDYEISLAEQRFTREIKLTRRYASESNENSFVRQRMLPAYREASKEFGRGQGQRLQGIVQGRITDGALFPDISFDISERVKGIVERTDQELQDLLRRTVKEVEEDVDIALSDLPDTSMSAEKEDKLKELLSKVSKLKDEAEAVGRLAAE
ncbi:Ras GTPase family protein [Pleurostoma richardsiae]|uniref:Ras GTPase family protein n=1 Tax=Pleurostoma richardsiae TaxID=41990 RepID=A0AA38RF12_9PEZI|nr:Ras GTPase family protein [Pleurostoma richardsiae]